MSSEIVANFRTVVGKLARFRPCRLVAVSKTKPPEAVKELYDIGHRHFGENYVQELVDKAAALPADVQWHFIGHLQSNKAKTLLAVPNLYVVESVDSVKLARVLNTACITLARPEPLRVMVQVNTSGEEQKSGVAPAACLDLSRYIINECPKLSLMGLMTIGKYDESAAIFFERLVKCREEVCGALGRPVDSLELSMGMSADYEMAAEMGSTNVRVGSTIFGARVYPTSAK